MKKITFIGAGNVAWHLAPAAYRAGYTIGQVFSRNYQNANALANKVGADPVNQVNKLTKDADLYIIAISDDAISEFSQNWNTTNGLVVHTSGSVSIEALKDASNRTGVLYPLQTFSKDRLLDVGNIPFFLEASEPRGLSHLQEFCQKLGAEFYELDSEKRKYLHLAAVTVNNFGNHLLLIASEMLAEKGLSLEVLKPLVQETLDKAFTLGPEKAQTGPAKRGDWKVVESHLELLKDPGHKKLYEELAKEIFDRYNKKSNSLNDNN